VRAEYREVVRIIPTIAERLEDVDTSVCQAAIEGLSRLAEQAEFRQDIWTIIPAIMKFLRGYFFYSEAIELLSKLAEHVEFRDVVPGIISATAECLQAPDWLAREASIKGVSTLAEHAVFQEDVRAIIPAIAECLKDPVSGVRKTTIELLSKLAEQAEFREVVRTTIPVIVEQLEHDNPDVREAAIAGVIRLAKQAELHKDIQVAIPHIVQLVMDSRDKDSAPDPRKTVFISVSALELLSGLEVYSHLSDTMHIVTVFLLGTMQPRTSDLFTTLILYLSKFLDNTSKDEEVQAN